MKTPSMNAYRFRHNSRGWGLALFLLLLLNTGQAQLMVNLQLPPDGIVRKSQLWNMNLVNTSGNGQELQINLVMTDLATNQPVLTAVTKSFLLAPGTRQIQMNDLLPLTYNVVGAAYNIDPNPDGFLPVGKYKLCYAFTIPSHHGGMAEECSAVEVNPLSPPQLTAPADKEQITGTNPTFTWIPPMPLNLFGNLTYELTLVEVYPGQTTTDAIQKNIPLYSQTRIGNQLLPYPPAAPPLQTGKVYAWRVKALNNAVVAGETEIWTFTVKATPATAGGETFFGGGYARLQKSANIPYVVSRGDLAVGYNNEAADSTASLRIYDLSATDRNAVQLTQPLRFGENFWKIDLLKDNAFHQGHIYLLQLTNSRRETWNLKFELHP
jgi:hypothetical protein